MADFEIDEDALLSEIDISLEDDLMGDFAIDLDSDALNHVAVAEGEIKYAVHRTHYTTRKGEALICFMTEDLDIARMFNSDLDEFTSYSYFILPEGMEVKNEKIMERIEDEEELVEVTEEEIRNSIVEDFNNLYFRAMLTQVY